MVLIANLLHFHRELMDFLGESLDHEFTVAEINWLGMVAYEYFLVMGLIGLFLLFNEGDAFAFLILFAPWIILQLEEFVAPFITYGSDTLVVLFIAETSTRVWGDFRVFGWEDFNLVTNLWEVAFDIFYKWSLYEIFKAPDGSNATQL